ATASAVGVLVMVWTVIGASPPTGTDPTMICRLLRRMIVRQGLIEDMACDIGERRGRGKGRLGHACHGGAGNHGVSTQDDHALIRRGAYPQRRAGQGRGK